MPVLLILGLLGFLVYSNSFHNSFHFDDYPQIIINPAIRDIHNLHRIWNCLPTRFITFYSFALNYHWGGLEVSGYHVLSLAVHVLTSWVVYALVLLIFRSPLMRLTPIAVHASWVAFFSAALFLVHPVQTEPVNYIFQRGVLLASFFYLGALTLYAKARISKAVGPSSRLWLFYYFAAILSSLLSMVSKEMSSSLPLAIACYEWFFMSGKKSRWLFVLPFIFAAFLIPLLTIHSLNFFEMTKAAQDYSMVSAKEYFLTQLRGKITYLRLFCWPFFQSVVYDYPLSKSFFELPVILSSLFLLFLLAVALKIRKLFPLLSFGILWFFITLLPESSIIPISNIICEYRLYLPMAGLSLFLSSGLFYLFNGMKVNTAIRVLFILIISFAFISYQRNKVWKDEFSLWDNAVHRAPENIRAYLNRGAAYQSKGDLYHALMDYNMVIGLGPVDAVTLSNRGAIFSDTGHDDLALANYNLAIKINPSYAGTYFNRGVLYKREGNYGLAIADLNKAIGLEPYDIRFYELRAETYFLDKQYDKAWADVGLVQRSGIQDKPLFLDDLKKKKSSRTFLN